MQGSHERLIRIDVEELQGGKLLISSPDVSLFHLAIASMQEMQSTVMPLLKETLERRLHRPVVLRPIDLLDADDGLAGACDRHPLPAHVIADVAA